MKKNRIVSVLLIIAIVISSILSLTACASKEPVTANDFQKKAEELGYTVYDVTEQYTGEAHILKSLAFEKDDIYMQFFEIDNIDNAKGVFNTNKINVESIKNGVATISEVNIGSYSKYTQKIGDKYNIVERVGTTFVYAESNKANAKILDDFLKDIGY